MIEIYTVDDLCAYFHVHRNTILRWIEKGELVASKAGRKWVVRPEDLEAYLKKSQNVMHDYWRIPKNNSDIWEGEK